MTISSKLVVTLAALTEDKELGDIWTEIVETHELDSLPCPGDVLPDGQTITKRNIRIYHEEDVMIALLNSLELDE